MQTVWKEKVVASDNTPQNIGAETSWTGIGTGLAHAITQPNGLAKQRLSERGIRVRMIIWHSD